MKRKQKILLINSRAHIIQQLQDFLTAEFDVVAAPTGVTAFESFRHNRPDMVVLDLALQDTAAIEMLKKIKKFDPLVAVIVTAPRDIASEVVKLIKYRVHDYFDEPINTEELRKSIKRALAAKKNRALRRSTVSVDVELFIKSAVDDIVKGDVTLNSALKTFKDKYVDYMWTKTLKNT